jgi:hypothetical protein
MINYLSDLLRNKRFERNVISNLNFLESRIQNLNERIRVLESTVVSQANTITLSRRAVIRRRAPTRSLIKTLPMENYQRKRLQPLALLVIGLTLSPLGIAPVTQMMQPALSNSRKTEAKSTRTAHLSPDITAHHHHHDSSSCYSSHGDVGGYDSGCSDSSSGSFD